MAKKVVAVQEGLHEVAEKLKNNGYQITNIDNNHLPIDVVIYSSQNNHYLAHNTSGIINLSANNQFVKMINVDEIKIDNIITAIEELD